MILVLSLSLSGSAQRTEPLKTVHDPLLAPKAWFAVKQGQAWVCWNGPQGIASSPSQVEQCWQRIPLELAQIPGEEGEEEEEEEEEEVKTPMTLFDRANLRAAFIDSNTLIIADTDNQLWMFSAGDRTLQPWHAEDATWLSENALQQPQIPTCSPHGWVPSFRPTGWTWQAARCLIPAYQCTSPTKLPRMRRPTGLRLQVGVTFDIAAFSSQDLSKQQLYYQWGMGVVLAISFDPQQLHRQMQARDALRRRHSTVLRSLPSLRSHEWLAEQELTALKQIICTHER